MIDLAAARDLKLLLQEGGPGTLRAQAAAEALIESIEDEYGVLTATNPANPPYIPLPLGSQPPTDIADEELIRLGVAGGHTEHCAKRLVWGDAVCECGLVPLAEDPPPQPQTITEWQVAIYQYALAKGWYDNDTRTFGDNCALFTSEISEAYDEYRNGHEVTETYFNPDKPEKAEGVPTELADCVIRILDFCQRAGIDLQAIMEQKHAYNLTRSYRHGNKRT